MGETLITNGEVKDSYKEHEFHNDAWVKDCSLCYEDKINTLAKYNKMVGANVRKDNDELLEIMESQASHPEEY